jgi:outer membrane protein, heavy metal efflux system
LLLISVRILFVCLTLWGMCLPSVWAQQPPTLELEPLLAEALRTNPEILAAQKGYEAARQRPSQQSSLPEPMFSVGYTSIGSPRPVAGIGRDPTANAGIALTQEFPAPGKRKLRGDIAGKDADALFQQYQLIELNVVSRVKQAYYGLVHAYVSIEVLQRSRELLNNLLRITEARYSAGRAMQQDLYKAQTQLSILETRLLQTEQEKRARETEINSLLNRRPESPLARPMEIHPRELAVTLDQLYADARANAPMLAREQKMVERSELAVNLARKEYYPDYAVTGGYFNQGSMPAMYQFRVDFKLPAYFWRNQRAGVAEQALELAQSRRNFEAADQSLVFRIKDEYLIADTSSRLMKIYGETVVPQATLALQSSLTSYETGSVDFLSVFTNFLTVVDYELNYHEEMHKFATALSRLEELTGVPLIK